MFIPENAVRSSFLVLWFFHQRKYQCRYQIMEKKPSYGLTHILNPEPLNLQPKKREIHDGGLECEIWIDGEGLRNMGPIMAFTVIICLSVLIFSPSFSPIIQHWLHVSLWSIPIESFAKQAIVNFTSFHARDPMGNTKKSLWNDASWICFHVLSPSQNMWASSLLLGALKSSNNVIVSRLGMLTLMILHHASRRYKQI